MATYKLEDLQQKLIKLMDHEKILKECLEMVRTEKTKLHIERLQIESMMDDLKLIQCKKFKPSSGFNPFQSSIDLNEDKSEDDTEDYKAENVDVNEQELQLDVSKTLHNMMMGNYEDGNNSDTEENKAGNVDVNEQKLQLDVSKTLHDMMMGTYDDVLDDYEGGFYEDEEEDDDDDDD